MSQDELKVLQKYLNDHLFKNFIQVSFSLTAALILFVHKSEGVTALEKTHYVSDSADLHEHWH